MITPAGMAVTLDHNNMRTKFEINGVSYDIIDLPAEAGDCLARMPYVHRILLENVLRTGEDDAARAKAAMIDWLETGGSEVEIPFLPNRVLMHDTTCGPALVDIAGMRSALAEAGATPPCSIRLFQWMSRPTIPLPWMCLRPHRRSLAIWSANMSGMRSAIAS